MSRTDKDLSTNAYYRLYGVKWWEAEDYHWFFRRSRGGYLPPARPSLSRTRHEYVRHYWHSQRFKVRQALRRGVEPEPSRTRHSVRWDLDW